MFGAVKDDAWELKEARLYGENLRIPQSQSQTSSGELGDIVDGGRLRYLQGETDISISCMCTCTVFATLCSGCMVYGPSPMAAI